jgi:hypothetical protein
MDPNVVQTEPVRLDLEAPYEVARWRPLVHWLLAIPHFFILEFVNAGVGVLTMISFFTILFTEKIPDGIFNFMVMGYRYQWRVASYVLFMREDYPPFEFEMQTEDPGTDPARLSIDNPGEWGRFKPLYKWLLAIPHLLLLLIFGIGALFAWIGAFFAVLFTGSYPPGMRDYLVKVIRYQMRIQAYACLLRDEYPEFGLK